MKAVLFDLGDTLYPVMSFDKLGSVVPPIYVQVLGLSDMAYEQLLNILNEQGRGRIFDRLLSELGIYDEDRVRLLVFLYRSHKPDIKLFPETQLAIRTLKRNGFLLGLITDGMASVQRNKIAALRLDDEFDLVLCTDEIGRDCWKPSVVPFKLALEFLTGRPMSRRYISVIISPKTFRERSRGMGAMMLSMPSPD